MAAAIAEIGAGGDPYTAAFRIAASAAAMVAGVLSIKNAIGQLNSGFFDGGYTGDGGKYEYAGSVHKGEIVWSQRDIANAGGKDNVEAWRKGIAIPADFLSPSMSGRIDLPNGGYNSANLNELSELKKEMRAVREAIGNISIDANQKMDENGLTQMVALVQSKNRRRFK